MSICVCDENYDVRQCCDIFKNKNCNMRFETLYYILKNDYDYIDNFFKFEEDNKYNLNVSEIEHIKQKYNNDIDNIITFDIYFNYLQYHVSTATIKIYKRLLKILLKELGYKNEDEDITQYLNKDFEIIKDVIDNLKTKNGSFYSDSTKKLIYQSITVGFYYKNQSYYNKFDMKNVLLLKSQVVLLINQDKIDNNFYE